MSKTYEYSVFPKDTDHSGLATVPSICANIINSLGKSFTKESTSNLRLLRSAFEIDERPRTDENYNVSVWRVEDGGARFSQCILLTDYDGSEIGRGTTEWCHVDPDTGIPLSDSLEQTITTSDSTIPCRRARRIGDFFPDKVIDKELEQNDFREDGRLDNNLYIKNLCSLLPSDTLSRGLSVRIDFDFCSEPRIGEDVTFGLKEKNDERFLFLARSEDRTLCRACLVTE